MVGGTDMRQTAIQILSRAGAFLLGLSASAILAVALMGTPDAAADHDTTNNNNWLYGWPQAAWAQFDSNGSSMTANVDWPAKLVFINNASINGVKNPLCDIGPTGNTTGPYCGIGLGKSMQMWTSAGWPAWDSDWGIKKGTSAIPPPICNGQWVEHMRLYAPSNTDQFFNPAIGFFVVATTHLDYNDLPWCVVKQYGYSDVSAWWFRNGIAAQTTWPIAQDVWNFNHGTAAHTIVDGTTFRIFNYNSFVSLITVS